MKIKDYSITLEDESGRTVELSIHADCIYEAMERGYTLEEARESIEENKAQNAIAEGLIGYECFLIPNKRTEAQIALSLAYAERGLEDRSKPIRQLPDFNGWTDEQVAAYLESL